jgi:L-threonate 2-dehydrogenase
VKVAVVGLGSMGLGIATSLVRAGINTIGYDVVRSSVERFIAMGGEGPPTLEQAVCEVDAVVLVVLNAEQVEAVLFASGGLEMTRADAIVIVCVTMAPDRARSIASRVVASGRQYIDAPISGGSLKAAEGQLTVLVSGPPDAISRANGVFGAMATKIYNVGDEPGVGSAFKLINQLLAGVHIAAACEAIVLAKRIGLDIAKVYEVIKNSAGNSWMFENRIAHVVANDYSPKSAVEIFTKDLGIVSDVSRDKKFATPMAASALQLFLMTASTGMGKDDDASVARLYALLSGTNLD